MGISLGQAKVIPMFNKCLWDPFYGWASLVVQTIKNLHAEQETRVQSLGQEDPTSVLLPREFHGQKSLVGSVYGLAKSWIRLSSNSFTSYLTYNSL